MRSIEISIIVVDVEDDGEPGSLTYLFPVTLAFIIISSVIGFMYLRGRRDRNGD